MDTSTSLKQLSDILYLASVGFSCYLKEFIKKPRTDEGLQEAERLNNSLIRFHHIQAGIMSNLKDDDGCEDKKN